MTGRRARMLARRRRTARNVAAWGTAFLLAVISAPDVWRAL